MTHRRLDDVISADRTPRNRGGIPLGIDRDGTAVNDKFVAMYLDRSFESSVYRVVLEHVDLDKKNKKSGLHTKR